MSNQFIGRGEMLAKHILFRLIPCVVVEMQVNITKLLQGMEGYDEEILNHNFDLVVRRFDIHRDIVVEVNYKHKEKAAKKSRQIFEPLLTANGYDYCTIDDYDCRKRGLFWRNTKGEHLVVSWDDYRDVIDSLEKAGVNPPEK
jgi:hypothetical protein